MKQIYSNLKKGEIKLMPETLDDLWYLNGVLDIGDLIKGKTLRKIKIGDQEQRKAAITKKPVFLAIKIEKIDFNKNVLRISGKTTEEKDDIPKGSYHSFSVEEHDAITIVKEKWLKFQLDKLNEACSEKSSKILICVHDREEAHFALLKKYGYELLSELKGAVQKKADTAKIESKFYQEIIGKLGEYEKKYSLTKIILASPAFWKEELLKSMRGAELTRKIMLAACSSVGKNGIYEVLNRPEVKEALKQERIAKESGLVEELLTEISKNNFAAYGMRETENASNAGAVKILLITDAFIQKAREEGKYGQVDSIMRAVEETNGTPVIVSSENEPGKKLDGLGGIGAILRFKLNY